jgi:anti-sigma B factor antagonist
MNPASAKIAGSVLCAKSDVLVVRISEAGYGSLDSARLTRLRRLLSLSSQRGSQHLIVDFSNVHYLGAGLIGIVVSAWNELRKQGRRLVLCGLNSDCTRLFHTLHLHRLIAIHPSLQAALGEIEGPRCAGDGRTAPPVRV